MKKKLSLICVCIALVIFMTGCQSNKKAEKDLSKQEATVINNEAIEEHLTSQELVSIYNENSAKFNSKYFNANIEIYGTVEKVSARAYYNNSPELSDIIFLKEGWVILLESGKYDFVVDLSKDDTIYSSGFIGSGSGDTVKIEDVTVIFNATNMSKENANEKINIQVEKNKLYEFFSGINEEMVFLYKNSENDAWGQESITAFKESIVDVWDNEDIDLDLISKDIKNIKTNYSLIQTNCVNMLEYIKNITSNFNPQSVKNIKDLSTETSKIIEPLLDELKYK